jgi:hypothetical protein
MTVDWSKSIRAYADWDGNISYAAEVVDVNNQTGEGRVRILDRHRRTINGLDWKARSWWFSEDGTMGSYDLTIRNTNELIPFDECEQWAKKKADELCGGRNSGIVDYELKGLQSLTQYIQTYDTPPKLDRAIEVARECASRHSKFAAQRYQIEHGQIDDSYLVKIGIDAYRAGLADGEKS